MTELYVNWESCTENGWKLRTNKKDFSSEKETFAFRFLFQFYLLIGNELSYGKFSCILILFNVEMATQTKLAILI